MSESKSNMAKVALPRKDRVLALLLAFIVCFALIAAIAVPVWMQHKNYDAYISDTTNKLARYERANLSRPQLIKQLETLRAREPAKLYLKGQSPALASAELQDTLKAIIDASGARLITIQSSAKDDGAYRQATASVQLSATIPNMRKMFYAIESAQPLLFIDTLNIRSQVPPGYKPTPGVEPEMYITFDASGFALQNSSENRPAGTKS